MTDELFDWISFKSEKSNSRTNCFLNLKKVINIYYYLYYYIIKIDELATRLL